MQTENFRPRSWRKDMNMAFSVVRVVFETLADERFKIFPRKNHDTKIMSNFAYMKLDREFLSSHLLFRDNESHKGEYGHLYLVCGCDAMPGAASLATAAALRSGCGLVTLHTSSFAAQVCAVSNPSAILSIDSLYLGFNELYESVGE